MEEEKVIHMPALVASNGAASALCFKKPKTISVGEGWAYYYSDVTCGKCLKLISKRSG